ncbi:hypothetical protein J3B02_000849 [Coemansia erecta]|nr:hypothetical protein J3B02_000849 [Coemansia erecta]
MPGLQAIIDGPSQYIGSLASSAIGGYVSDVQLYYFAKTINCGLLIISSSNYSNIINYYYATDYFQYIWK